MIKKAFEEKTGKRLSVPEMTIEQRKALYDYAKANGRDLGQAAMILILEGLRKHGYRK